MTPEQIALNEWHNSSEQGLRSELWLHGLEPSEIVNRDILINMLKYIYFGGEDNA